MATTSFVLLCAEEDDLALVKWVHAARSRGLAPEVVTGVEHDDGPLLDALADPGSHLFVVLRSDSLDAGRMREIKSAFAKHRSPRQRLFAMRVDYSADVAIDRIVAELEGKPRARSETSMVLAFEDVTGPHRVVRTATGSVPTVDAALRIVERATEHEVTERVDLGQETIPMIVAPAATAPSAKPQRRWARAAAWIGGLGLAAAASGVAVIGANVEPNDAVRGSSVAPADGSRASAVAPRATAALANDDDAIEEDEAPVVIHVAGDSPSPERAATPRRRSHDRGHSRGSDRRAAAPSELPPPPTPAPAADTPAPEPAVHDAIPLEPAPLEPEPVAAEPAAAPP